MLNSLHAPLFKATILSRFWDLGDLKVLRLEYDCIHSLVVLCSQQVMASRKWCEQQLRPLPCDIQSEWWQRLWMNWDFNSKHQLQVGLVLGVVTNSDCFDWKLFFSWMELSVSLCLYFTRIPPVMAVMAITHWSDRKSNTTEDCTTILSHYWTVWSICRHSYATTNAKKDRRTHSRR